MWLGVPAGLAGLIGWALWAPTKPREVDFARVKREDLATALATNGRVEPIDFAVIKSDREGVVSRVAITKGQEVAKGQTIVEFAADELRVELQSAEARVAQVETELAPIDRGGSPAALAEIDALMQSSRSRRDVAQREMEALERLVAKGAATKVEATEARDRVAQATTEISSLEVRRRSLLPPEGRQSVEARIREARAAVDLIRRKLDRTALRSPTAGVAYSLGVKPGAFVHAGEVIAEVGQIQRLRLVVYVDEPELGRVSKGMELKFTWDALPDQNWTATVERMPTQVLAQGSRQVGEVIAVADNVGGRLPPGANVNVEIQTDAVRNAITIPRGALHRQETATGVWLLAGDTVVWRSVGLGVSTATRAQILHGLAEGDAVALPSETPMKSGEKVRARLQP